MEVKGHAYLWEGAPLAKLPDDLPESLVLRVLDVCGAPAQVHRLVKPHQTVVILGAGGKSGLFALLQARKNLQQTGKLIALDYADSALAAVKRLNICDAVDKIDARDALAVCEKIRKLTDGKMADLVINTTNVSHTEMACILSAKPGGRIYFFNMATDFARAALGAEGAGQDVEMVIGNGFTPGHVELSLTLLRESRALQDLLQSSPRNS
jgi:L-erythro-3,5-diaminohexanoate dehydrogenase